MSEPGHAFVVARFGGQIFVLDPKHVPLAKQLQPFLAAYLPRDDVQLVRCQSELD